MLKSLSCIFDMLHDYFDTIVANDNLIATDLLTDTEIDKHLKAGVKALRIINNRYEIDVVHNPRVRTKNALNLERYKIWQKSSQAAKKSTDNTSTSEFKASM
jgi:hypothetical protein